MMILVVDDAVFYIVSIRFTFYSPRSLLLVPSYLKHLFYNKYLPEWFLTVFTRGICFPTFRKLI
jgi:hypothetical protein